MRARRCIIPRLRAGGKGLQGGEGLHPFAQSRRLEKQKRKPRAQLVSVEGKGWAARDLHVVVLRCARHVPICSGKHHATA